MKRDEFFRIVSFFAFPFFVFLISSILGFFLDAYEVLPWLDIPMHVFGGVAIAYMLVLFLNFFSEKKFIFIKSKWVYFLVILGFVSLIAVLWEFYEFLMKFFFGLPFQPSLEDTILDLFLGLFGGVIGAFLFRKI